MLNTSVIERLSRNPIIYQEQRCITLALMDEAHERPKGTAGRAFRQHRDKLSAGKHFFDVPYSEWSADPVATKFVGTERRSKLLLLTERGYLLLVKSFQDELAWKVQEALVDGYFAFRERIKQEGVTAEQVSYMIAQTLQTVLPQVLAPIHEVLRQHTAILDRLVNQGGEQRRLGDTVVVRQRIREMWPGASEPKRKAICNEVTSRIRDMGGVVYTQFGRILIERNHLFILDGVIDQMKGRALERETLPLMDISRN